MVEGELTRHTILAKKFGGIFAIKDREMHAVESHQAKARSEPQITIPSLSNRLNRILRQALIGRPGAEPVACVRQSFEGGRSCQEQTHG